MSSTGKGYVGIKGYDSTTTYSLNEVVLTVSNNEVKLALSDKQAFEKSTSHMTINDLKSFEETTFSKVVDKLPDNEALDYTLGANIDPRNGKVVTFEFFKYTFYRCNTN